MVNWDFIEVRKTRDLVHRHEAEAKIAKLSAELNRAKDRYSVYYNAGYEAGRKDEREAVIAALFSGRK